MQPRPRTLHCTPLACGAVFLAVTGCSDPPRAAMGLGIDAAVGASADVTVTPDASPVTDTQALPDAAPVDAAMGAPAVTITGVWRTCDTTLHIQPDGTWLRVSEKFMCQSTGRWVLHGTSLDLTVGDSTCMTPPVSVTGAEVSVQSGRMVILHPMINTRGQERYFDDTVPHIRWRLTGERLIAGGTGTTVVRLVGDPANGVGSGCYWSGDGACNGIFSCGGTVTQWNTDMGMLGVGLSCIGGCTCGVSLVGTVDTSHLAGHYNMQNCNGVFQGTLTGVTDPDD